MKQRPGSASFKMGFFLVFFFALLFLLPSIITRRQVSFSGPSVEGANGQFPLDTQLVVYRDGEAPGYPRGKKIQLKELLKNDTQPILINFWATWCPPCLEELPSIELLNKQVQNSGTAQKKEPLTRLITISVDDRIEDISRLETSLDFKPTFTVLHDKEGGLARSLGTTKFPETYLVSPEGQILYRWLGPQNWLSSDVLKQLKFHSQNVQPKKIQDNH